MTGARYDIFTTAEDKSRRESCKKGQYKRSIAPVGVPLDSAIFSLTIFEQVGYNSFRYCLEDESGQTRGMHGIC